MSFVKSFLLPYSPFFVLAAAAIIAALHIHYYW
jgi:hypothetical protein